jgi:hypothetical protein
MGLLEPHGRGRQLFRLDELTLDAPVIVVHSLAHAVAALTAAAETGRPVILASAPGAGIYGGPGWWNGMIAAGRAAVPSARATALLDCGDDAGAAQGAIRAEVEGVIFTGRVDVAERLADIAAQAGIRLAMSRPAAAFDLAADFFASPERLRRRCAMVLASHPGFC